MFADYEKNPFEDDNEIPNSKTEFVFPVWDDSPSDDEDFTAWYKNLSTTQSHNS